jgi:Galactose-3-O-sulfotransferase
MWFADRAAVSERRSRCLVFLHVPKTAGTTLRATLRFKYPGKTVTVHDFSDPAAAMEKIPFETRRSARVITGHLLYGVHRYIPQECDYVTVLRHPVARAVSEYHYGRSHTGHHFHEELVRGDLNLTEFVEHPRGVRDNLQTRIIAGTVAGALVRPTHGGGIEPTALGEATLETAKERLQSFLVAGLTERFDESFILIRRALGWRLPMYATRRVTKRSAGAASHTSAEVDLVRARNQLDVALYEHAQKLLDAAVSAQGASFRREVAAFKLLNRIPNAIGPQIPARLRHPLRAVTRRA